MSNIIFLMWMGGVKRDYMSSSSSTADAIRANSFNISNPFSSVHSASLDLDLGASFFLSGVAATMLISISALVPLISLKSVNTLFSFSRAATFSFKAAFSLASLSILASASSRVASSSSISFYWLSITAVA